MGFFDFLKKGNEQVSDISPWDGIIGEFQRIYPGQVDPKHYSTFLKYSLGGPDPLDGMSVYDGGDFWHFVTFGMTELYEKKQKNKKISGYGYEMTFKLKKGDYDEEKEFMKLFSVFQNLARYTFETGTIFKPYESIQIGHEIDDEEYSEMVGFMTIPDPSVQPIQTNTGKIEFLEFIGLKEEELRGLSTVKSIKKLYEELGTDVTDYER
ncbi:suppressor of fused domain protein [Guggenheimella bovis]